MTNCSSVDGQAAFLDETTDHRHIDYFQGLEKFREQGLPCELPVDHIEPLKRDPHMRELEQEIQRLENAQVNRSILDEARRRLSQYCSFLELKVLAHIRRNEFGVEGSRRS